MGSAQMGALANRGGGAQMKAELTNPAFFNTMIVQGNKAKAVRRQDNGNFGDDRSANL